MIIRGTDGQGWEASPKRWLATTVPQDGGIDQKFKLTPANASFTYTAVYSQLTDPDHVKKATFYLDPRALAVNVGLQYGATSALLEWQGGWVYLVDGTHTLLQGGEYSLSVGTWVIAPGSVALPRVSVGYSRLKP